MDAGVLEQRLREHPDDATSWQVYGDWLLERGDQRGALIQLEQRLDREAARPEIDALIEQHEKSWSKGLPKGVRVVSRRYGFATKLSITWTSAKVVAKAFAAPEARFATGLRITLPEPKPGDDDDDADDEGEFDEDGPPLVVLEGLETLELPQLTELDLSYVRIGPVALPRLDRLQVLDLRYCALGDEGVAGLAKFTKLKRLHVQRNGITAAGAAALRFAELVELDLRYNDLGADGVAALLAAPFIGSLSRLELYRSDVSPEGAQTLASAPQLAPALRAYWRGL